jgi:MFS family permease
MNTQQSNAAPVLALGAQASLMTELRELPRAAWVLFLGIFLNRFGTFVVPFLALILKHKGYSLGQAGIAVGSYGTGTLFACFLGGYLADQIGRRKTITLSMFGGAATMLLLSRADSFWSIVLLTGLNGLCGELYRPASSALLADLVPNGQRVIAFSAYRMALNAGWAFGPAAAGFVPNDSFHWLFVGDALSSLLFGLVAWTALPHGVRAARHESGWGAAVKDMRRNPAFLTYLAASIFIAWVFFQISSTYGLFITELGYSRAVYGGLISFNGIVIVICELLVSSYTRRFEPRRAIACGYLLVGIGFGLNAVATSIPALAAAIVILTFGEMISIPIAAAFIADVAPEKMRGRYMGAHGLTWGIALVFGPSLGMFLLNYSAVLLWVVCLVSGIIGAAIMLTNRGARPQC